MRLHRLEITAFGPFAEQVDVDLDELSDAGLFLLTGPTGAGKSSVLDAVAFALYGVVPGDRGSARHLRSDHAVAGTPPRVRLEVSIGSRTFRFTRVPAWERPKKRGNGTTTEHSRVVVDERREGDWETLATRQDEAGLLVADLLGMTATQFTQVAMLPQGQFQRFLTAPSPDRQAVLQRLFRTDRFERVERWLSDRRTTLRRALEDAAGSVRTALGRIEEVAATALPDELAPVDPASVTETVCWVDGLVDSAAARRAAADATRVKYERHATAARTALTDGQVHAERRRRVEAARSTLADHDRHRESWAADAARLDGHRRAVRLDGHLDRLAARAAEAADARTAWAHAAATADCDEGATIAHVEALREQVLADLTRADGLRPRVVQLERARATVRSTERRLTRVAEARKRHTQVLADHPGLVAAAESEVAEAVEATAALTARRAETVLLEQQSGDAARLAHLSAALVPVEAELAAAVDRAQDLRETHLAVREARIHGMAAELAGTLVVGCACPVCGSEHHPVPADADQQAVTAADEDVTRAAYETADFERQALHERVTETRAEIALLEQRLDGVSVDELDRRHNEADRALAACTSLAALLDERRARVGRLRAELAAATADAARADAESAGLQATLDQARAAVTDHEEAVDAALGEQPDLATHLAALHARRARLDEAATARRTHDAAVVAHATARSEAEAEAAVHGFTGLAEIARARLAPDAAATLADEEAARESARQAAAATLAEPGAEAILGSPPPDLPALEGAARDTEEALRDATTEARVAARGHDRLVELRTDLMRTLDAWQPLAEAHAQAHALARLVEGTGPENPHRIRLAAYVLGERLRQVVAAANERLGPMTGDRYLLEQTDDRAVGEVRGGLSLLVRDAWTGRVRRPATLSGGETFIVSLALALGLADTVAHEAGGIRLDTLFIDEGFGTLDRDTLDDVLDTLDALRDGGRVVGVVSHVEELRHRIPTRLEVRRGRHGSTVRSSMVGS